MRVKLLLAYDVKEFQEEAYYQFIIHEFLPRAEVMGLKWRFTWQTAYGDYPSRLVEFLAQDEKTMRQALKNSEWDSIETKLGEFVDNYEKRVVRDREDFQFFIPQHRLS